jgi:predicted nucleotide-binding protein
MSRTKVFISYSHNDETWRKTMVTQLLVLQKQGLLEIWDDTQIGVGEKWFESIHASLSEARVAVLLAAYSATRCFSDAALAPLKRS